MEHITKIVTKNCILDDWLGSESISRDYIQSSVFLKKKNKNKKNNELEVLEVLGSKGINKLIPFW